MDICVDVDSVVADLETAWLARYNADYGDNMRPSDLDDWYIDKKVKCGKKIYEYLEDPSLYDNVKPIKGALQGVQTIREMGHRVIFATSSPNGSAGRKLRWLLEHKFMDSKDMRGTMHKDYIEIHDKSLLRADVLIDDGPHNIQSFRGTAILFRAPHNRNMEWPLVANDWNDVVAIIQNPMPIGTHVTELRRPIQTRAFREVVERMYQVHLAKNADYSPANILGAGEIGLMTRVWDKVSRLMNLMGFKVEIASMKYTHPEEPKNESIDDNVMDLAVYGIIWQLYRKGAWGK